MLHECSAFSKDKNIFPMLNRKGLRISTSRYHFLDIIRAIIPSSYSITVKTSAAVSLSSGKIVDAIAKVSLSLLHFIWL
jgi:hypothetical protein